MIHTLEKQLSTLRSAWRTLVIFFFVAIGGFSIITVLELEGYIHSSDPHSWKSLLFLTVFIVLFGAYPFFTRFRLYRALKAVKDADDLEEIEIQCTKIRFIRGNGSKYTPYLIAAVFTDANGNKYTYVFEESMVKNSENCELYKAKKGCTFRLFCYKGTNLVGKIR